MFKNIDGYSEDRYFNIETFSDNQVLGICSDGIGGKVYPGQTKEQCLSWASNKKEYKNNE